MPRKVPYCPDCGYNDVRIRIRTGEMCCRHCGYVGRKEEFYGIPGIRNYSCPLCGSPSILASLKTRKIRCLRCGYIGEKSKFLKQVRV